MNAGGEKTQTTGQRVFPLLDDPVLIGSSPLFQQVLTIIDSVAANDCVVLIEGESGTGKELLAKRIHLRSVRSPAPFIPVNCAGVSESLFESQFYGHIRGAFTGATTDTLGIVRAAEGGTLLLDEVGELPLHLQPKLLRVLQEYEVTPVGASRPLPVDVRFVASTNRSLAKSVSDGNFRSDLYHRLNIVRVHVPPLRNRPEDIDELLDHYLVQYADEYGQARKDLPLRIRQRLREYAWPGNVRELCGYVERLYATNLPPTLPAQQAWDDGYYQSESAPPPPPAADPPTVSHPATPGVNHWELDCCSLADAEAFVIRRALQQTNNNHSAAARLLNIHRSTLLRKLRTLGFEN